MDSCIIKVIVYIFTFYISDIVNVTGSNLVTFNLITLVRCFAHLCSWSNCMLSSCSDVCIPACLLAKTVTKRHSVLANTPDQQPRDLGSIPSTSVKYFLTLMTF